MSRLAALLPIGFRRRILAMAEVGKEDGNDLELAFLPRRRSLLIDVGANRGQFARFAAPFYDRVVVFEPIAAFRNELSSILPHDAVVYPFALADFAGPATFHIPTDEDQSTVQTASLLQPNFETAYAEVEVAVRRLDDFGFEDVSFIKVDIEGAEYAFLEGAVATLVRCRPTLLIEIEDRHTRRNSRRVFDRLADLGYDPFIPERQGGASRSSSTLVRLGRGAATAAQLRAVALTPISAMLDASYARGVNLNASFGDRYVNNFLFVPRSSPR